MKPWEFTFDLSVDQPGGPGAPSFFPRMEQTISLAIPGQTFSLTTARLYNRGKLPIKASDVTLVLDPGWKSTVLDSDMLKPHVPAAGDVFRSIPRLPSRKMLLTRVLISPALIRRNRNSLYHQQSQIADPLLHLGRPTRSMQHASSFEQAGTKLWNGVIYRRQNQIYRSHFRPV